MSAPHTARSQDVFTHPPTRALSARPRAVLPEHRPTLLESVRLLYQGMLRTLLVLLHDFPEFLSDYHLSFCDVIPPTCIQLRNLVLASFPRSMRLPDPFTPNLKVNQHQHTLQYMRRNVRHIVSKQRILLKSSARQNSCACSTSSSTAVCC